MNKVPPTPNNRNPIKFLSHEELFAPLKPERGPWGPWKYNHRVLTLDHSDGYQIDLERIVGSAGVLDPIAQVASKAGRFSAMDVGYLVLALNALAHLQQYFCGCGKDHPAFDLGTHLLSTEPRRP
jgi:hypothetical protein